MKSVFLIVLVLFSLSILSCSKCKTCYLIEEQDGERVAETHMGEFCGKEIKEQEEKEYRGFSGPVYAECR